MKKRILVILLAVVLVLSAVALIACQEEETLAQKAKSLVSSMYRDKSEVTTADYEMPAQVYVDGTAVTIAWTVDNSKVTVDKIEGKPSMVLINITETTGEAPTGYSYKLTATATDAQGNTASVSFDRKVPDLKILTWAEYAKAKAGDLVTVEGVVTAVAGKNVFMQDDVGGYYLYGAKTDVTGLEVGQTILATGTMDIYNGTFEVKDATFVVRNNGAKTELKVTDYTEIFKAAGSDMKNKDLASKQALLVTIKGVTLKARSADDEKNNYYRFTLGEGESYFRISGSINPMSAADTDAFKAKFQAGYTADVTGLVTVYNDAFYLSPISVNALDNVTEPVADTDEAKVALDKDNLTLAVAAIKKAGDSIELPATGTKHASEITWALKEGSTVGAIAEGKYTVATLPAATTAVTLVATLKKGDATATKEVVVNVAVKQPANGVAIDVINAEMGAYPSDAKEATVNGTKIAYVQVGSFGSGIQFKKNEGVLYNTTAFAKNITYVSLQYSAKQSIYPGNTIKVEFAATADFANAKTVEVKTTTDKTIVVTMPEGEFKFVRISNTSGYALYFDMITILIEGDTIPDYAAMIGSIGYNTLEEALAAADEGDTIVLRKNVEVSAEVRVTKKITLNLNGKTISNTANIYEVSGCSVIAVYGEGELTITGSGKVIAKANDCYALSVFEGGKLTVENGEFLGNIDAVYAYEGHVVINGGKFDIQQLSSSSKGGYTFLLNLDDAHGAAKTATITVKGGEFVNYDPSHSKSEEPEVSFVASGYKVTSKTADSKTIYTVVPDIMDAKSISIEEYASNHSLSNSDALTALSDINAVTVTSNGKTKTGKYYTSNHSWRLYQTDEATLTIAAKEGYTITSVKITYDSGSNGVLLKGETQVKTGEAVTVTGNTVTLSVGQTTATDKANGNVQITKIEVTYTAAQA